MIRLKLVFICFISLLVFSRTFANDTMITGHLPGGENQEIRLSSFSDYITLTESILGRTIIDSNAVFSFHIDISETKETFLDIEYYTFRIYIQPGGTYILDFDSINMANEFRPYYMKENLTCNRLVEPNPQINHLVNRFEGLCDKFLLENFNSIYNRHNKTLIKTFQDEIGGLYDTVPSIWFQTYKDYKIASILLAASSYDRLGIFQEYIDQKPVKYSHPGYMYFFNQYFDQYLTSGTRAIQRSDLIAAINAQKSYPALLDTLGKDTLLRNERIRELVMLKSLKDFFYNNDYSQESILNILGQVAGASRLPDSRLIARNIMKSLTHLMKGTDAPDFTVTDFEGNTVELSDFFGKPVYLSFMTTWSYACLGEFRLLDSLYRKYGEKINFITVSFDKKLSTISSFKKDKNYNWTFLYNGTRYDLMKEYDLKTFPVFALVSADGKILQYPAYKPSEIIEEAFMKLTQ